MTYANATKRQRTTSTGNTEQIVQMTPEQFDLEQRTQILRRAPYGTTTTTIINELTRQFKWDKPENYIYAVLPDADDRRRFYITYTTYEHKRNIAGKGYMIGNTNIPGMEGDVSAFIPYPPHYVTRQTITKLLEPYGKIITGDFKRDKNGIRVGGYDLTMDMNAGRELPKTFTVYNKTFNVINKDDKRQCTHCKRYGHTRTHCRQLAQTQQQLEHPRGKFSVLPWQTASELRS